MRLRRVSIKPKAGQPAGPGSPAPVADFGNGKQAEVPHLRHLLAEEIGVHQLRGDEGDAKDDPRIGVPPIFFTADQQIPTGR